MVRKSVLLLTVVTLTAVLLYAQEGKKSAEITGLLIDSNAPPVSIKKTASILFRVR